MSWGLADEAAYSVRWLSAFSLPGPALMADLLELNDDLSMAEISPVSLLGNWFGATDRLCPLITGAALSDSATRLHSKDELVIRNITQPLLLLPFAGSAALILDTPVAIEWQGLSVTTNGRVLCIDGAWEMLNAAFSDSVRCSITATLADSIYPKIRGELDATSSKRLSTIANRTYAPATKESRRLGAG